MSKPASVLSRPEFDLSDDEMVTETDEAALQKSLEEFESFDDAAEKSKRHLE
jgi:hypothetical protein